jgi:hypothetical protein
MCGFVRSYLCFDIPVFSFVQTQTRLPAEDGLDQRVPSMTVLVTDCETWA